MPKKPVKKISKDIGAQREPPKLSNKDEANAKPIDTLYLSARFRVRGGVVAHLDLLYQQAKKILPRLLAGAKSSKDFPELPSMIANAMIRKYAKAKQIHKVTLPCNAYRGEIVRLVPEGLYVTFLKTTFPVKFQKAPEQVLAIEFIKRKRVWFLCVQYRVSVEKRFVAEDVVGVDSNSRGNVATIAFGAGKVRRLGPDLGSVKYNYRKSRRKRQKKRQTQKLKKMSQKQSRSE